LINISNNFNGTLKYFFGIKSLWNAPPHLAGVHATKMYYKNYKLLVIT